MAKKKKFKKMNLHKVIRENFKGTDEEFNKTVAIDPILSSAGIKPVIEDDIVETEGADFQDLPMSGLQDENQTIGDLKTTSVVNAQKMKSDVQLSPMDEEIESKKYLTESERYQMNLNAEKLHGLRLKKEILEGRMTVNSTQAEFIKAKLEVVERDRLLLDHAMKDIGEEINAFMIESKKHVAIVRHKHGIKNSSFGYDPDNGEISID